MSWLPLSVYQKALENRLSRFNLSIMSKRTRPDEPHTDIQHQHKKTMKSLVKKIRNKNIVNVIRVFNPEKSRLIVFFPGWLSTEITWRYFLPELSKNFRIEYFESREKPSAQPSNIGCHTEYHIECQTFSAHGDDAANYLNSLNEEEYYVIAASVGASVFLSIIERLHQRPKGQVLISPSISSPLLKVSGPLSILLSTLQRSPSGLLYFLRPVFIAIIKRLAANKDAYQVTAAINSLAAANLSRVTASARQLLNFELDLAPISEVNVPTLIVTTTLDSAHHSQDAQTLNACLPNSSILSFSTFAHARSSVCAQKISNWINDMADVLSFLESALGEKAL